MKNIILFVIIIITCSFYSCEKDTIPLYENNSGVYFKLTEELQETSYSFFQHPGINIDTIFLDVFTVGKLSDKDRKFNVEIIKDSTDAPEDTYTLLSCFVPANETKGQVAIKVIKKESLKDKVYNIRVKLQKSEDFPLLDFSLCDYNINLTSMLSKPDNWDSYCSYFFGEKYSDNWLQFIVDTVNDPNIGGSMHPKFLKYYNAGWERKTLLSFFPDPRMESYALLVKQALVKYNRTPEGPLKHNDGTIVVMP